MSKILVLTSREVYPTHGGDKLRIFKICEYLSKYHSLDIISLTNNKDYSYQDYPRAQEIFNKASSVYHNPLKAKFFSLASFFSKKSMQEWYYYNSELYDLLKERKDEYDYLLIHLFRMEQYAKLFEPSKVHIELTDAISMNYSRLKWYSLKGLKEFMYYLDRKKILKRELRIMQKYRSVSLISNTDKKYLNQFKTTNDIKVFKNGVSLKRFQPVNGKVENNIVFIGNIFSAQNEDACRFFIEKILPSINEKYPDLNFKIVGLIPDQLKLEFEENSNVIVTGKVESIQHAVGNPVLGVCPMRYGAGIQNKILEYLAMGIPVISSRLGIEGLENLKDQVFIAETPEEYIESVEKIIWGREAVNKLFLWDFDKAKIDKDILRSSVEQFYSWEQVMGGFEEVFDDNPETVEV